MAYKDKGARYEYNNKYNADNYERVYLTVPKGDKERIKAYAESQGESINSYINRLISDDMSGSDK